MKLADLTAALDSDLIDLDARMAALEAVGETLKIYQRVPHLSVAERNKILAEQVKASRRDYLDCYQATDADQAWHRAFAAVRDELGI